MRFRTAALLAAVVLIALPSLAVARSGNPGRGKSGKEPVANCKNAAPLKEIEVALGLKQIPQGSGPVGHTFQFKRSGTIVRGTDQGTGCSYAPPAALRKEPEESFGVSVAFNETPADWKATLREDRKFAQLPAQLGVEALVPVKLGGGVQSIAIETPAEVTEAEGGASRVLTLLAYTPLHNIFYILIEGRYTTPIANAGVVKLARQIGLNLDKEWKAVSGQ